MSFTTIVQLATPFAILFLGWFWTHKQKRHEEELRIERKQEAEKLAAERELAERKRDELNTTLKTAADSLTSARKDIDDLYQLIESINTYNSSIKTSLTHIATMNRMNGQYTHELSQLVTVLAEGLRDQHLDGNITKAVEKYRSFESNTLGSFITGGDGLHSADHKATDELP